MNLFEIILVALLGVYVLSNLYFTISGRILAIKGRKEDIERRNKDEEYENQLNILTKRVGEVGTENHNLKKSNMEKKDEVQVSAEFATSWKRALNAARKTVGKKRLDKEPSDVWKGWMLLAEHSPIRLVEYDLSFEKIRQWVTVHIVRHWLGFIPFVHSQRQDRRQLDCDRDDLPQGSLNDMDVAANAQALINVSRKRLCSKASPETRIAWQRAKNAINDIDPVMASKMVPNCIYRGFCPERETCGYAYTEKFRKDLEEYRKECTELHKKQIEENKNVN